MISESKAVVKASACTTINLGNYENAKIEAGIELPVEPTADAIKKGYEKAWKEIYRQLEIKVAEIKKGRNK